MWISVWITFNKNSNDYYYCFSNLPRARLRAYLHPHCATYLCIIIQIIIQLYPTCKNVQNPSYPQIDAIILYCYCMFYHPGYIYIFRNGSLCPRVGMCSTPTPTSKLYQIFTQFTKSPQIHFDSHFDKILKIQAKINFLTI